MKTLVLGWCGGGICHKGGWGNDGYGLLKLLYCVFIDSYKKIFLRGDNRSIPSIVSVGFILVFFKEQSPFPHCILDKNILQSK